jgi:hypothetical protein
VPIENSHCVLSHDPLLRFMGAPVPYLLSMTYKHHQKTHKRLAAPTSMATASGHAPTW